MMVLEENGIGRIEVSNIPLPDYVQREEGTYTYSGKVLVSYKTKEDMDMKDYYNIATVNDNGTDFKVIFAGNIPQHKKANGIRFMPYQDNKRVLLGDYVLECSPDINQCEKAELIPIIYPKGMVENENVAAHWSEIIIAPNNQHISWTALRSDIGANAFLGELNRKEDNYVIENTQIISNLEFYKKDAKREGFLIPQTIRGGEVKQFVRGGEAISLVGQKEGSTPNSVVQDLASEEMTQITFTPGYDETTIFSPDEHLGIVMSARASKNTNMAIFGLLPRPHASHTFMGISRFLYQYSVTSVREFRKGNVGPILIDIEKSMNEPGYEGVALHDPEENWVFTSPMSWHPDGTSIMWPEILRGSQKSNEGIQKRLRKAKLIDYIPAKAVDIKNTPANIPYGEKDLAILDSTFDMNVEGNIAGKHTGYIRHIRKADTHSTGKAETYYENYSDDGKNYHNGYEKFNYDYTGESCYKANIVLSGNVQGEMKFQATFSPVAGYIPTKFLFDIGEDGKPKSYGYAQYNGITLHIDDLAE